MDQKDQNPHPPSTVRDRLDTVEMLGEQTTRERLCDGLNVRGQGRLSPRAVVRVPRGRGPVFRADLLAGL